MQIQQIGLFFKYMLIKCDLDSKQNTLILIYGITNRYILLEIFCHLNLFYDTCMFLLLE